MATTDGVFHIFGSHYYIITLKNYKRNLLRLLNSTKKMKNKLLILLFILFPVFSFAQGIDFRNLSYDEALQKAKSENKLVFIDCYTTWCGPCKTLANDIFTLKEAGDFFNNDYIAIKLDMEKGANVELAKELVINAYPTMMVVDGDRNVIVKMTGALPIKDIKVRINEALANPLYKYEIRYKNNELSQKEMITYITLLGNSGERDKAKEIANKLVEVTPKKEHFSKDMWKIYSNRRISYLGTDNFQFLCDNKKQFEKVIGKKAVDDYLYYNYFNFLISYIYGNIGGVNHSANVEELEEMLKTVKKLKIENSEDIYAHINMAIARSKNDAVGMSKELLLLEHKINDRNLWGYGSSYINVFKSNPEAVNEPIVKQVGQMLADKASDDSKKYYINLFKLNK